jgi:hypothetical protein
VAWHVGGSGMVHSGWLHCHSQIIDLGDMAWTTAIAKFSSTSVTDSFTTWTLGVNFIILFSVTAAVA